MAVKLNQIFKSTLICTMIFWALGTSKVVAQTAQSCNFFPVTIGGGFTNPDNCAPATVEFVPQIQFYRNWEVGDILHINWDDGDTEMFTVTVKGTPPPLANGNPALEYPHNYPSNAGNPCTYNPFAFVERPCSGNQSGNLTGTIFIWDTDQNGMDIALTGAAAGVDITICEGDAWTGNAVDRTNFNCLPNTNGLDNDTERRIRWDITNTGLGNITVGGNNLAAGNTVMSQIMGASGPGTGSDLVVVPSIATAGNGGGEVVFTLNNRNICNLVPDANYDTTAPAVSHISVTLNVATAPAAPAAADQDFCELAAQRLTATPSGGGAIRWYDGSATPTGPMGRQFIAGAATPIATGNTFNPNQARPGTYTYFVTEVVGGCESPVNEVTMVVRPSIPQPNAITAGVAAACPGDEVTFTVMGGAPAAINGQATEYVWTPDPNWTETARVGSHQRTYRIGNPGINNSTQSIGYSIVRRYTAIPNCTSPARTQNLNVNSLPTAAIGGIFVWCQTVRDVLPTPRTGKLSPDSHRLSVTISGVQAGQNYRADFQDQIGNWYSAQFNGNTWNRIFVDPFSGEPETGGTSQYPTVINYGPGTYRLTLRRLTNTDTGCSSAGTFNGTSINIIRPTLTLGAITATRIASATAPIPTIPAAAGTATNRGVFCPGDRITFAANLTTAANLLPNNNNNNHRLDYDWTIPTNMTVLRRSADESEVTVRVNNSPGNGTVSVFVDYENATSDQAWTPAQIPLRAGDPRQRETHCPSAAVNYNYNILRIPEATLSISAANDDICESDATTFNAANNPTITIAGINGQNRTANTFEFTLRDANGLVGDFVFTTQGTGGDVALNPFTMLATSLGRNVNAGTYNFSINQIRELTPAGVEVCRTNATNDPTPTNMRGNAVVRVRDLLTTQAITGPTIACEGENGVTFTQPAGVIDNAATARGTSRYVWTLPTELTHATGSNNNMQAITVNVGTFTGTAAFTNVIIRCRIEYTDAPDCQTAAVTHTLRINRGHTVSNAGPDQDVCTTGTAATTAVTLAANDPGPNTGRWFVVSAPVTITRAEGFFANRDLRNSRFDIGNQNNAGAYVLRWQINGVAGCTASNDNVQIDFGAPPAMADAGNDAGLCRVVGTTAGIHTMSANDPAAGGRTGMGTWTATNPSGNPIVLDPNAPNASNAPLTISDVNAHDATVSLKYDATDLNDPSKTSPIGAYTFTWTISSGTCTDSTDDVVLTVEEEVRITTPMSGQTLCVNVPVPATGSTTVTIPTLNMGTALGGNIVIAGGSQAQPTISRQSGAGGGNTPAITMPTGAAAGEFSFNYQPTADELASGGVATIFRITSPNPTTTNPTTNCGAVTADIEVNFEQQLNVTTVTPQTFCQSDRVVLNWSSDELPAANVSEVYNWTTTVTTPITSPSGSTVTGVSIPASGTGNVNQIITNNTSDIGSGEGRRVNIAFDVTARHANCTAGPTTTVNTIIYPEVGFTPDIPNTTICSGAGPAIVLNNDILVNAGEGATVFTYEVVTATADASSIDVREWGDGTGMGTGKGFPDNRTTASNADITEHLTLAPGVTGPRNITFRVTPEVTFDPTGINERCTGDAEDITITVNPVPRIEDAALDGGTSQNFVDKTMATRPQLTPQPVFKVCSGQAFEIIPSTQVTTGVTYSWPAPTTTATGITGRAPGSNLNGIRATLTLPSTVTTTQRVTYVVTPAAGGCSGAAQTILVDVVPLPVVTAISDLVVCSGETTAIDVKEGYITENGLLPNIKYDYRITNFPKSGDANYDKDFTVNKQSGSITGQAGAIDFTFTNEATDGQTRTVNVEVFGTTASTDGSCAGNKLNFSLTVLPKPEVKNKPTTTQEICNAGAFKFTPQTDANNVGYIWTVASTATTAVAFTYTPKGGTAATAATSHTGSGTEIDDVISFDQSTTGTGVQPIRYTITPLVDKNNDSMFTMADDCAGTPFTIDVNVNPQPILNVLPDGTICSGVGLRLGLGNGNLRSSIDDTAGPATGGVVPNILTGAGTTAAASNVTVNWTAKTISGTPSTYPTSGTGDVTFAITNTNVNGTDAVVEFEFTPSLNGCTGPAVTRQFTIKAAALFSNSTADMDQTICNGAMMTAFAPTSTYTPGPTYDYEVHVVRGDRANVTMEDNNGTAVTRSTATPSTLFIAGQNLANGGNIAWEISHTEDEPVVVEFRLVAKTPGATTGSSCGGGSFTHTVTVEPVAEVTSAVTTPAQCQTEINTTNTTTGATTGTGTYGLNFDYTPSSNIIVDSRVPATDVADNTVVYNATIVTNTMTSPDYTNFTMSFDGSASLPLPTVTATTTGASPRLRIIAQHDRPTTQNLVVRITPVIRGCVGTSSDITIPVRPVPKVILPATTPTAVCSGETFTITLPEMGDMRAVTTGNGFTSDQQYTWVADIAEASPGVPGNRNHVTIPGVTLGTTAVGPNVNVSTTITNNTTTDKTVVFTITPSLLASDGGCAGPTTTRTVVVHPTPQIVTPNSTTICSTRDFQYDPANPTAATPAVAPTNFTPGTTVSWELKSITPAITNFRNPTGTATASMTATDAAGTTTYDLTTTVPTQGTPITGNTLDLHAVTTNSLDQHTLVFEVTPIFNGCEGTPIDVTLVVNPSTDGNFANDEPIHRVINSGDPLVFDPGSTLTSAINYDISAVIRDSHASTDPNVLGDIPNARTTNGLNYTNIYNKSTEVDLITFSLLPEGTGGCTGANAIILEVYVLPEPKIIVSPTGKTQCVDLAADIKLSTNINVNQTQGNADLGTLTHEFTYTVPAAGTAGLGNNISDGAYPPLSTTPQPTFTSPATGTLTLATTAATGATVTIPDLLGLRQLAATTPPTPQPTESITYTNTIEIEFTAPTTPQRLARDGMTDLRPANISASKTSADVDAVITVKSRPRIVQLEDLSKPAGSRDVAIDGTGAIDACFGDSKTLQVDGSNGFTGATYKWEFTETNTAFTPFRPAPTPFANKVLLAFDGTNAYEGTLSITSTIDGCDSETVTVAIRSNARPVAHAGADQTTCAGVGVQIGAPAGAGTAGSTTDSASGGSGTYTYLWTGAGLSDATIARPMAAPNVTTTYQLTVTDDAGCISDVDEVTVTVFQSPNAPTISFADGAEDVCERELNGGDAPAKVILQANVTGGNLRAPTATDPTYEWYFEADPNPTALPAATVTGTLMARQNAPNLNNLFEITSTNVGVGNLIEATGWYRVVAFGGGAGNPCPSAFSQWQAVRIRERFPKPTIAPNSGNGEVCFGTTVQLDASFTLPMSTTLTGVTPSYRWEFEPYDFNTKTFGTRQIIREGVNIASISKNLVAESGKYYVTLIGPGADTSYPTTVPPRACESETSAAFEVYIHDQPTTPSITLSPRATETICAGETQVLTANGDAATRSFVWTKDGSVVTNGPGFSGFISTSSTSPPPPADDLLTINGSPSDAGVYTVRARGYEWIKTSGTYCESGESASKTIVVNPKPVEAVIDLQGPATFCEDLVNNTVRTIVAKQASNAMNFPSGIFFTWEKQDLSADPINDPWTTLLARGETLSLRAANQSGRYRVTAISQPNCEGLTSAPSEITINPGIEKVLIDIPNANKCEGDDSVNGTITITGGVGPFNIEIQDDVTVRVATYNGVTKAQLTGGLLNFAAKDDLVTGNKVNVPLEIDPVNPNRVRSYTYTLKSIMDANGCSIVPPSNSFTILVTPQPKVSALRGQDEYCADSKTTFAGMNRAYQLEADFIPGATYRWNIAGGFSGNSNIELSNNSGGTGVPIASGGIDDTGNILYFNTLSNAADDFPITVEVTLNGCTTTVTKEIDIISPVTVDAGLDLTLCSPFNPPAGVTGAVTPSIQLNATVTPSYSNGPVNNSLVYAWTPNTGFASAADQAILNPTVSPTVTTTYRLTVTDPLGGCSDTFDEVTVTVEDPPVVSFDPTPGGGLCILNTTYDLTATAEGTLSNGTTARTGVFECPLCNINTITETSPGQWNFDASRARVGNHIVYYIFTDDRTPSDGSGGCKNVTSQTFRVYNTPTLTLEPFDNQCYSATPNTGKFDLNQGRINGVAFVPGPLAGTQTYTSTNAPTGSIIEKVDASGNGIGEYEFDPNVSGPGTFVINYDYNDSNNCTGTGVVGSLIIDPLPNISIDAISRPSPNGNGVTIPDDQFGSCESRYTLQEARYSGAAITGADKANIRWFIDPTDPVNQANGVDAVIAARMITELSPGATTSQGMVIPTGEKEFDFKPIEAPSPGDYVLSFEYTEPTGTMCTNTVTRTVTINVFPRVQVADFDPNIGVCDTPFTLTQGTPDPNNPASSAIVKGGLSAYSGNGVAEASPGVFTFDPAAAGVGIHLIQYSFTDIFGCKGNGSFVNNVASKAVTVNPPPFVLTPDFGIICPTDGPRKLTEGVPAGGEYEIASTDVPATAITTVGTGASTEYFFDPALAGRTGSVQIRYTIIDATTGCSGSSVGTITVNPAPDGVILENNLFCNGGPLAFELEGIGPFDIVFEDNFGNQFKRQQIGNFFIDNTIMPGVNTTYSLVSIVDRFNCINTNLTPSQAVILATPTADFTATPLIQVISDNTQVAFANTSVGGELRFTWDFDDGTSIQSEPDEADNVIDVTHFNGSKTTGTNRNPVHTYIQQGFYNAELTVSDKNGRCTDTKEQLIEIKDRVPIVDFEIVGDDKCIPATFTFKNLSKFTNTSSYTWDFGDGIGTSTAESPTYIYSKAGTYTVTLKATNTIGFPVQEVKIDAITVDNQPEAKFSLRPKTVYLPDKPVFFTNLSFGATTYEWDFGDGSDIVTEEEPFHVYKEPGIYDVTLKAINGDTGCEDELTIRGAITAIKGGDIRIPNVFTPSPDDPSITGANGGNGQGASGGSGLDGNGNVQLGTIENNVFIPVIEGATKFQMEIYDRWGNLLFVTNTQAKGWNGYYKGKLVPMGVYVYHIEVEFANGIKTERIGDLTLIR